MKATHAVIRVIEYAGGHVSRRLFVQGFFCEDCVAKELVDEDLLAMNKRWLASVQARCRKYNLKRIYPESIRLESAPRSEWLHEYIFISRSDLCKCSTEEE